MKDLKSWKIVEPYRNQLISNKMIPELSVRKERNQIAESVYCCETYCITAPDMPHMLAEIAAKTIPVIMRDFVKCSKIIKPPGIFLTNILPKK